MGVEVSFGVLVEEFDDIGAGFMEAISIGRGCYDSDEGFDGEVSVNVVELSEFKGSGYL